MTNYEAVRRGKLSAELELIHSIAAHTEHAREKWGMLEPKTQERIQELFGGSTMSACGEVTKRDIEDLF
jgi:hypothetical protein